MSNVSSIYDRLRTVMSTALPTHIELANPYVIDADADLNFEKGYAIGFADAINSNRFVGCKMSVTRDFVITITRQLFTTDRDIESRITTEKDLLEDHFTVIKEFENNPNLEDSSIVKAIFVQDGGLEFIRVERTDLLMIQSVFNIEYFEDLTL